jgi:hypothetical protein
MKKISVFILALILGSGYVFSQCTPILSANSESIKALGEQRTKSNSFLWVCKGKSLILIGSNNTVYAEDSAAINASGDSNTVYLKQHNTLDISGSNNSVSFNSTSNFTDNGTFTVKTNCPVMTFNYTVAPATGCDYTAGLETQKALMNFFVHPVPTGTILYLNFDREVENGQVTVYSIDGKRHSQVSLQSDRKSVDVSDLSAGVYYIELKNNEGRAVRKFIKQ